MPKSSSIWQARYDAANTTGLHLKLSLKYDADILARLDAVGNKQGYIKALIRADINAAQTARPSAGPSEDADS